MIVIDDFFSGEKLSWVRENSGQLMKFSNCAYFWWDGWWKKPAKENIFFQLIERIHREVNPLGLSFKEWDGFEFWMNTLCEPAWAHHYPIGNDHEPASAGEWHVDGNHYGSEVDETPPYSCIYYLDNCLGGYLEILPSKCWDMGEPHGLPWHTYENREQACDEFAEENPSLVERIQCKANRLVIIDPAHFHRVSEVYGGVRRAITINIYKDAQKGEDGAASRRGYSPPDGVSLEELEREFPELKDIFGK